MSGAAWTMLIATWAVILYFTGKFFWMVLTTPSRAEQEDPSAEGNPRKDA